MQIIDVQAWDRGVHGYKCSEAVVIICPLRDISRLRCNAQRCFLRVQSSSVRCIPGPSS